jgi:hypothetical protein
MFAVFIAHVFANTVDMGAQLVEQNINGAILSTTM